MLKDLLHGLRTMARTPGITATAALTLALGIGVNTAMFSVVSALLLRPLPWHEPGRLVTIRAQIPSINVFIAHADYHIFSEWWKAQSRSFESMSAFAPASMNLTAEGEPEQIWVCRVNHGLLPMIGVRPALGRGFLPEEDEPGAPQVAMLGHRLWQRRFSADPAVLGRSIVLDQKPYTVVGVLPPDFESYGGPPLCAMNTEIYVPIAASTADRGKASVGAYARLKPGVTLATAQAEIDDISRRWVEHSHYPPDWRGHVWLLRDYLVRDVRSWVVMLAIAVGLVLLIACVNVANLLLSRAAGRQREIALRGALGASRLRLIRQLLTESAALALISGALGLLAAWGAVRLLSAGSGDLPFQQSISIDATVLWFTMGVALLANLLFGLMPAVAAARGDVAARLKEDGRAGESRRRARLRSALVVAEVALSLLLAIGATLTIRSLMRLQAVDPGFDAEGVLTAYLTLPPQGYSEPARRVSFYRALVDRLEAIPEVQSASGVSHLPFSNIKSGSGVFVEDGPPPEPGNETIVFWRSIHPDYFRTVQVPLLSGRFFTEHDPSGEPVAIVNETLARRFWPDQDPIGKRFGDPNRWATVVGVVGDMRQSALDEAPDLEAYMPHTQTAVPSMALVIRTSRDPVELAPAVRAAVRELDRELPLSGIGPLADSVSNSTRSRRFSVTLLGGFAVLAVLLAAVGIYGVISYSVTRRTREIGVRIALGAHRGGIVRMVVGHALLLGAIGVVLGIAGSFALTRLLNSMLYGVSATDPGVFAGVSALLLAVAALAGYIPAMRAARVDPNQALRCE